MIIQNTPKVLSPVFEGRHKDSDDKSSGVKSRSGNMLMGALIALASMAPVNSASAETAEVSENPIVMMADDSDEYEAVTVDFNDENGILEPTDFEYSSDNAKKLAKSYLDGLNCYMGKLCTQAISDMANNLTKVFNMSNNYAYDLNTDEMVKEAESFIAYDRAGKVLSTKLKYSTGDEDIVTYKYFPNGSVDRAVYSNDMVIEYRKDGTRFSCKSIDPFRPKEEIRYDRKGNCTYKSVKGRHNFSEFTFDEQGRVIKHFNKDDNSGFQKIYNNGVLTLTTYYDGKGRVKDYSDNYFEKEGDDLVVGGYLSRRTVRVGQPYNTLYKQAPLDGRIIQPIRQGTTGTCYIAGVVNSLVRIPAGRNLLDRALPADFDDTVCEVEYKGLNKKYSIPAKDISHNMSRLGRKDADYSGMVMAYEKFRESDLLYEKSMNLPDFFYKDLRGETDRRVDSGTPLEFFYALTGKIMNHSGNKITDADIQKARQCLATGKGIVNLGTVQEEDKNYEIPITDRANGIVPKHILSVIDIGSNDATLYDSVTEKEFVYPLSKLKKFGTTLYWATVD